MKSNFRPAFTLIELIFVIVIIGVLASVAIPKFSGLSDNAKISAELSTAASVQVALDACHGEWIINEGSFTCGTSIPSTKLNTDGYPEKLEGDGAGAGCSTPLCGILKHTPTDWSLSNGKYTGPASGSQGAKVKSPDKASKPDGNDYWEYDATKGTFKLVNVN